MRRKYRTLLLPTLAVLLPCAFMVVLTGQWLALERDAAVHRGAAAAEAAATALRAALRDELRAQAMAAAGALAALPADRPSARSCRLSP